MGDVDDWQRKPADSHGLAKTATEIKLDILKEAILASLFITKDSERIEIVQQVQEEWPEG